METDYEIQRNVLDEIRFDPFLSSIAPLIGVTVKDGIVTLSGQVDSFIQKHAVEDAAKRVKGVSFVAVDIEVVVGTTRKRSDSDIARHAKESLRRLSILDMEALDVQVDDGWITLEGTVRWNYERAAAEEYVRNLDGVRGIINKIVLSEEPCDVKTVTEKIIAAFHRHAALDATSIRVEIEGEKAVLTGNVRSWIEKKDAENVVWSSPGIRMVENKLEVCNPYVR